MSLAGRWSDWSLERDLRWRDPSRKFMAASSIMPVGYSKAEMGRENWLSELCVVQNSWTTEWLQLTVSPLELGWFFSIVKTERREPGFISLCLQDTCELPVLGWGSSLCLRHFLWCKELWAIITQCPLNCEIRALTLSRYLGFKVLTAHTCPTSQPKEQSHNLRKSLECAYNSEPCIHTASTLSFDGMRGKGMGKSRVSLTKNQTLSPVGFCTAPEGVQSRLKMLTRSL